MDLITNNAAHNATKRLLGTKVVLKIYVRLTYTKYNFWLDIIFDGAGPIWDEIKSEKISYERVCSFSHVSTLSKVKKKTTACLSIFFILWLYSFWNLQGSNSLFTQLHLLALSICFPAKLISKTPSIAFQNIPLPPTNIYHDFIGCNKNWPHRWSLLHAHHPNCGYWKDIKIWQLFLMEHRRLTTLKTFIVVQKVTLHCCCCCCCSVNFIVVVVVVSQI